MPQSDNYEIVTNIASSQTPTVAPVKVGDPTQTYHAVTRAWLEETGFSRSAIHEPVQTIANAKAIAASEREDKMLLFIDDKEAIYFFDSSSVQSNDDDLVLEPDAGTGRWIKVGSGASVADGIKYTGAYMAETIDGSDYAKAVCVTRKDCIQLNYLNTWLDVNEGGSDVEVQVFTAAENPFLIYDLGVTADTHDMCKRITDALNASALTYTYTCSFSAKKFTIATSPANTFSIKWKTGTHGSDGTDTSFAEYLGFSTSADDASLTSYTSDVVIDYAGNSSYVWRVWASNSDAYNTNKNTNTEGFINEPKTKRQETTIRNFRDFEGFTGILAGKKYYNQSSKITISSGNQYIDFKDPTTERSAQIPTTDYYRGEDKESGYEELCTAIKAAMEAVSSYTFDVVFDKNTNKFTISSSSGNFDILFSTGTNVANCARDELGFSAADTGLDTSHTSDNAVLLAGEIIDEDNAPVGSVYVGKGLKPDKIFAEKSWDESVYSTIIEVATLEGEWDTAPSTKDFGEEVQFHDEHENANGVGVRLVSTIATPCTFKFRYKTGPGAAWQDATTTYTTNSNGNVAIPAENFSGNYFQRSRVFVDENGKMVAALTRWNTSNGEWEVWAAYSEDGGDNWTLANGSAALWTNAAQDYYVGGLYIRADKAVILVNREDNTISQIRISNYSSGYGTWASAVTLTNDYVHTYPSAVLMAYNSAWTGDDKYKIICMGTDIVGSDLVIATVDGAGANEEVDKPFGTDNRILYTASLDKAGTGNKALVVAFDGTVTPVLDVAISDDVEGSITFTDKGDAQGGGGSNVDFYNGYSSANITRLIWNAEKRCVLYGNYVYILAQTDANASSKKELGFFHSTDLGSTWETKVDIGGADDNQECCLKLVNDFSKLIAVYKYNTNGVANNLTNGEIYQNTGDIAGGGSVTWAGPIEISSKLMGGFAGFLTISEGNGNVSVSWEELDGAYDVLKGIKYA